MNTNLFAESASVCVMVRSVTAKLPPAATEDSTCVPVNSACFTATSPPNPDAEASKPVTVPLPASDKLIRHPHTGNAHESPHAYPTTPAHHPHPPANRKTADQPPTCTQPHDQPRPARSHGPSARQAMPLQVQLRSASDCRRASRGRRR